MNKPRGRPPGNPKTKERIAEVARSLFLERGYRRTTMRMVAGGAAVDVALISYYFGSKQGLFGESMALLRNPSTALADALEGDPARMPERLIKAVTDLWEDPDLGTPMSALNRMALQDEKVMRVFREYLEREVLARIAEFIGGQDASERAAAAITIIGGLIFTRYLVRLNGPTQLPAPDVQRIHAALLRSALNDPSRFGATRIAHRPLPLAPTEVVVQRGQAVKPS
jgi:AcrR family transcriptional regulator